MRGGGGGNAIRVKGRRPGGHFSARWKVRVFPKRKKKKGSNSLSNKAGSVNFTVKSSKAKVGGKGTITRAGYSSQKSGGRKNPKEVSA